MNQFGQYPFVRILLPFLCGILAKIYLDVNDFFTLILFGTLFSFYLIDYFKGNLFGRFSWRVANGIYVFVMLFSLGSFWTGFFDDRKSEFHYVNLAEQERTYSAEIIRDPILKEKSVKTEVQLQGYSENGELKPLKGKVILYFRKDSSAMNLKYGDQILVNTNLQKIPPPQNPDEFNYQLYCSFHRIYAQGFADEFHWKKTGEGGNSIYRFASESRKGMLSLLKNAGLENQEYAVAAALILGYIDEIDQETKMAYSASGALHVLSVSGLHVAIIFAVFDKLLFFLLRFRHGKFQKAITILIILWLYALLTGLSPSVMRSAAMLSFVVIGKLINRNASIYNILSASAFVLLCIDPLMIMEVGFQLSYLAVLGIVYLHPKIYHLFFFRNRLFDFTWNVTAVSLAAQVATFPLGLLYFHQFPNYFLVSNLIVIPLGTFILYNGILALLFSFIPGISDFLIFTLKWSVKILNESVYFVERLPYSLSTGISITIFETWLIYLGILTFLFFTDFKKSILLKVSLASFSLLFILFSVEKWQQNFNSEIVVYHIKKESAIDLINGRNNVFISSDTLQKDENKMLFHVYHHWDELGINKTNHVSTHTNYSSEEFYIHNNYFSLKDLRMVSIHPETVVFSPKNKLRIDVLVLSGNPNIKLSDVRKMYDFEILVMDASNSFYRIRKWKEEVLPNEKIHVVSEEGAYIRKV